MPVRRYLTGALGLGLAATALPFLATGPAQADPDGTGLVISEVYGAGGNSGAVRNADFVELFNPTDEAVDLAGLAVHYRSAAGGSGGTPYALSGSVPAGGHFLIRMSAPGSNGAELPTPDAVASPAFNLAAAGGQVYLLEGTAPITTSGDMAGAPSVVDMVGAASATSFETAPTGTSASATSSLNRDADGTDTDDNAADFRLAAPTPTPAGTGPDPDPDPEPTSMPIADIQGDGAVSPKIGQTVITEGVVTAIYSDPYPAVLGSNGGYDGIYVQTAGTGGAVDATPGRSDAIFVWGNSSRPAGLAIGDSVRVTGTVSEFSGSTQITPAAGGVVELSAPLAPVAPAAIPLPTTEAGREAHEGELLAPTDPLTVTNTYTTNQYAEIGLATGTTPLLQPTDVARPGTPEYDAVVADNAARAITLDDATSVNFLRYGEAEQDIPLPWLSHDNAVRVGAEATLRQPVILEFRNSTWKIQPTSPVTDEGTDVVTFENTRAQNLAPQDVGGDLKLATFNVLNYFNTTGEDFVANGGSCTFYTDRDDNPIANDECTPNGPRGAADTENLLRQQAKIVAAINGLGADVVSLEELENSVKLLTETDRDDAIRALVEALNAAAGAGTWAYVASPAEALEPANVAEQDVIRNGFIYKPARVELVGESDLLFGEPAFANAREPLAQAFKPAGAPDSAAFTVVVNHFKSKGCGGASGDNADAGDGQSCFNGDRTRQAMALANFAADFAEARGTEAVFLVGDLNSYTEEDPMHVLYGQGYEVVESDSEGDWSYSFSGLSGSLDHVLGNAAAVAMVTGADVWEINANESIAFQYSRYNYNVTDFYRPDQFAASDHNPEIVGLAFPEPEPVPATVTASVADLPIKHKKERAEISVEVSAEGATPTGTVSAYLSGELLGSADLVDGATTLEVGPFAKGTHTLTLVYSGDAATTAAETTVEVVVTASGKPRR